MSREVVLKLMRKKDEIEREINQLGEVLESVRANDQRNVGMRSPLVDAEGYPRIDIDIFQVRVARQKIICLQNDHKAVMKEIEECLHEIHAHKVENDAPSPSASSSCDQDMFDMDQIERQKAIAKIDKVVPSSPAELAGLAAGDFVIRFGSISSENYRSLQDISNVVQHSIGKTVPVTIKRDENYIRLSLTPNTWSGRGLLGFVYHP